MRDQTRARHTRDIRRWRDCKIVAAVTVHWQNGWLAIAEGSSSLFANERTIGAIERLDRAKEILREHGH